MRRSMTESTRACTLGLLVAVALASGPALVAPLTVHAAAKTFTVNSAADDDDGACTRRSIETDCTLREAMAAANANPGKDRIAFNIPSSGAVKTIQITSKLPDITDSITIDGYTQPGAQENTLAKGTNAQLAIVLDGPNAGGDGLRTPFGSTPPDGVVIPGLVIHGFVSAIVFGGGAGHRIEGNFLGTDQTGTAPPGNSQFGVFLAFDVEDSTIGGASPAARNLISGNGQNGLHLQNGALRNTVQGNLIGTDKTGTTDLGNGRHGLQLVATAAKTTIAANTIAFNGRDGVNVFGNQDTGNRIAGNRIFANGEEGIDLNDDGPTANDPDDGDKGGNRRQNFPVVASVTTEGGEMTVTGKLVSTPNKRFVLQFFTTPAIPSADAGEGKDFLFQRKVTTNDKGKASFTFTVSGDDAAPFGAALTATATNDATGDTSEFSAPARVTAG